MKEALRLDGEDGTRNIVGTPDTSRALAPSIQSSQAVNAFIPIEPIKDPFLKQEPLDPTTLYQSFFVAKPGWLVVQHRGHSGSRYLLRTDRECSQNRVN